MEIPKNSYACANCHQRFDNPTILIKHVELRHSIAKQSQICVRNTEPKEKYANIENRDLFENSSASIVPFEFSPITKGIGVIFPQAIEVLMKDQIEEVMDQDKNSEVVSVQEIDKDSSLLTPTEN